MEQQVVRVMRVENLDKIYIAYSWIYKPNTYYSFSGYYTAVSGERL
jgi:hypothetical protein